MAPRLVYAETSEHLAAVSELLRQYRDWAEDDHCFEKMDAEIRDLPGSYARPAGRLLLAEIGGEFVACAALRPADARTLELKRLFVADQARGKGLGRLMVQTLMQEAKAMGAARMILDTLPKMTAAIQLYRSLGFRPLQAEFPAGHPIEMELAL